MEENKLFISEEDARKIRDKIIEAYENVLSVRLDHLKGKVVFLNHQNLEHELIHLPLHNVEPIEVQEHELIHMYPEGTNEKIDKEIVEMITRFARELGIDYNITQEQDERERHKKELEQMRSMVTDNVVPFQQPQDDIPAVGYSIPTTGYSSGFTSENVKWMSPEDSKEIVDGIVNGDQPEEPGTIHRI